VRLRRGSATLRIDARSGTARLRATRGAVRSVVLTLDGRRLRRVRGGSARAILSAARLRTGTHVLRALVRPRHGKPRRIVLRFTVSPC
jgi:hypothetical protein